VGIQGEDIIKELDDFLVGERLALLKLWEVVVDVFEKQLIVEPQVSDEF
jgi:hypothetical protein